MDFLKKIYFSTNPYRWGNKNEKVLYKKLLTTNAISVFWLVGTRMLAVLPKIRVGAAAVVHEHFFFVNFIKQKYLSVNLPFLSR